MEKIFATFIVVAESVEASLPRGNASRQLQRCIACHGAHRFARMRINGTVNSCNRFSTVRRAGHSFKGGNVREHMIWSSAWMVWLPLAIWLKQNRTARSASPSMQVPKWFAPKGARNQMIRPEAWRVLVGAAPLSPSCDGSAAASDRIQKRTPKFGVPMNSIPASSST